MWAGGGWLLRAGLRSGQDQESAHSGSAVVMVSYVWKIFTLNEKKFLLKEPYVLENSFDKGCVRDSFAGFEFINL